jgi:EmrB/QacA subfamily drug resistance transporter
MTVTDTRTEAATRAADTPYRYRWLVLGTVLAAEIMDLLDATVINIAAPSIRRDLGGSFATIQWIAAGYTLAFAVMLITGGRLGDIVGRRRTFVIGAAGFAIGSALCAAAPNPEVLIACRVLQGAFGAILIPQGFGVLKQVFPPAELPKAFGMFGPVMGLSAVGGPILAGALIDADWFGTGWRMIFLINLPIGVLAVAAALRFMPESRSPHSPRLDLPGMVLVTAGSLLLIYPLVEGRDKGWPVWCYLMIAAALPVFGFFAWYQRRRGDSPLVEPSLFGKRAFVSGLAVITVFFAAVTGFGLTFGLFAQLGLGYSPLRAGLTMAPWAFGIAVGAALSGAVLAQRYGRKIMHAGLLVAAGGLAGVGLTLVLSGSGTTIWQLVPAMIVTGFGTGLIMAPLFDVILAGVEDHEVGSASGVLNAMQQFGSAAGVATLGTVFLGMVDDGHPFVAAMRRTSWVAVALVLATFAIAYLLPRRSLPGR